MLNIIGTADRLRLLVITASFHPTVGGAETYAYEVAKSLAKAGHAVAIVTDLPRGVVPGHPVLGDPGGVAVHRLSDYRRLLEDESKIPWEQLMFGLLPELRDMAEMFLPNVVLSNSLDTALLAKMLELNHHIPWVAAFHEHEPEAEPLGTARLRLVYEVLRPGLVLAGSEFYAARARRWGCADRVALIYHGVDTDQFHPGVEGQKVRQHYGISHDQTLIVCVGRLKKRKGMRELICAFGRVAPRMPNSRLLIVGSVSSASRDYADELRRDAKQFGVANAVLFDETVTFNFMPSVLAAADIVAQPSLEEGLGLSIIEAMASGKPVLTTDIPGIQEITTEPDVALVVPPDDPPALADALALLLTDEALRRRLGKRGREHAEHKFSRARMVSQTEAALLGLIRPCTESI
jgi:glycosyltransferase involved in cell wall biosynthesis